MNNSVIQATDVRGFKMTFPELFIISKKVTFVEQVIGNTDADQGLSAGK